MSSRTSAGGLFASLEKDEEDDWVNKGTTLLDQKAIAVKAFPLGTLGGPSISDGHRDVSPPKVTGFGPLGRPSTFGETGTSKRAGKVPLGD